MDINRLNEFITLASLLNYSKAANQLYLTQPALSRHIHDLENTLGAPLFIRDTHSVHLTSIGELFYDEAKEIVEHYNHALLLVQQASANPTGELKLGFLGTASQSFLSEFVSAFTSSHPDIKLSLSCGNMNQIADQLSSDAIDIGIITHISKDFQAGIESELINKFTLYAIVHPHHPYAGKDDLSLNDLSGFPFINFSDSNHLAKEYNRQLFKKAGSKCNTVEEVDTVEAGIFMASINRGFFIMPEYLLDLVPDSLAVIPLSDKHCNITLNLIWKKTNTNDSLPLFIKEFRMFIKHKYKEKNEQADTSA